MQPPPLNLTSLPPQSSYPGNVDGEIYNAHSPPIPASPEPEPGPLTEVENQLKELAQSLQAVGNYVQRFHHGIHPTQNQVPGQGQPQGSYTALGVGRAYGGANGGINGIGLEDRPLSKRVQNLVGSLMAIDTTARQLHHQVPRAVLDDLDQSRNPGHITKDRLEAVALENAFLHAKLDAVVSYRDLLGDALADEWTELECLRSKPATSLMNGEMAGRTVAPDTNMEVES